MEKNSYVIVYANYIQYFTHFKEIEFLQKTIDVFYVLKEKKSISNVNESIVDAIHFSP